MNKYAIIMAGGGGTRFWPLSRQDMPKQLLNLSGSDVMINETIKRIQQTIDIDKIFIVTNSKQAEIMKNIVLSEFPKENILIEPAMKNTAACILYGAMYIMEKHGDGILSVFPSDHYVTQNEKFISTIEKAIDIVDNTDKIVTIGIEPTFPSTGYGYIKKEKELFHKEAYKVDLFVEKPNFEKAKAYIKTGDYYWNSGMFVWKTSVVLDLFKRFLPKIYNKLEPLTGKLLTIEGTEALESIYKTLDSISIDYGIMERTDDALVIPGDFGWNDVGSWDSLGAVFPLDSNGNIVKNEHVGVDTKGCIIYGDKKLIATVDINNLIVVDTDDAILICSKDKAQNVKDIVDILKELGKVELL